MLLWSKVRGSFFVSWQTFPRLVDRDKLAIDCCQELPDIGFGNGQRKWDGDLGRPCLAQIAHGLGRMEEVVDITATEGPIRCRVLEPQILM